MSFSLQSKCHFLQRPSLTTHSKAVSISAILLYFIAFLNALQRILPVVFDFCLLSVPCWDINFVSFCVRLDPGAWSHRVSGKGCWEHGVQGSLAPLRCPRVTLTVREFGLRQEFSSLLLFLGKWVQITRRRCKRSSGILGACLLN